MACFGWEGKRGLTVGEACFEEVVISSGDFGDGFGEIFPVLGVKIHQRAFVGFGDDHDLERPGRPPGTAGPETVVLEDGAFAFLALKFCVVFK